MKIKPTQFRNHSSLIKTSEIPKEQLVSFNFKRLCRKGDKFNYEERDPGYFIKLLHRLRDVSSWTRTQMTVNSSKALRCHKIDFVNHGVSESTFGVLGEDVDCDAWQFELSQHEHGRIHGYFVHNTFYVVWLDPNHELYCN